MVAPLIAARVAASGSARGAAVRATSTQGVSRQTVGRIAPPTSRPASTDARQPQTAASPARRTLQQVNDRFSQNQTSSVSRTKSKNRVGVITAGFMVGIALLFDLLQFLFSMLHVIPFIGTQIAIGVTWFITVLALGIFGLWFTLLGVKYFTGKQVQAKLVALFGPIALELIPLVGALPAITAGVVVLIVISRYEDAAVQNNPLAGALPLGRIAGLLSGKK